MVTANMYKLMDQLQHIPPSSGATGVSVDGETYVAESGRLVAVNTDGARRVVLDQYAPYSYGGPGRESLMVGPADASGRRLGVFLELDEANEGRNARAHVFDLNAHNGTVEKIGGNGQINAAQFLSPTTLLYSQRGDQERIWATTPDAAPNMPVITDLRTRTVGDNSSDRLFTLNSSGRGYDPEVGHTIEVSGGWVALTEVRDYVAGKGVTHVHNPETGATHRVNENREHMVDVSTDGRGGFLIREDRDKVGRVTAEQLNQPDPAQTQAALDNPQVVVPGSQGEVRGLQPFQRRPGAAPDTVAVVRLDQGLMPRLHLHDLDSGAPVGEFNLEQAVNATPVRDNTGKKVGVYGTVSRLGTTQNGGLAFDFGALNRPSERYEVTAADSRTPSATPLTRNSETAQENVNLPPVKAVLHQAPSRDGHSTAYVVAQRADGVRHDAPNMMTVYGKYYSADPAGRSLQGVTDKTMAAALVGGARVITPMTRGMGGLGPENFHDGNRANFEKHAEDHAAVLNDAQKNGYRGPTTFITRGDGFTPTMAVVAEVAKETPVAGIIAVSPVAGVTDQDKIRRINNIQAYGNPDVPAESSALNKMAPQNQARILTETTNAALKGVFASRDGDQENQRGDGGKQVAGIINDAGGSVTVKMGGVTVRDMAGYLDDQLGRGADRNMAKAVQGSRSLSAHAAPGMSRPAAASDPHVSGASAQQSERPGGQQAGKDSEASRSTPTREPEQGGSGF